MESEAELVSPAKHARDPKRHHYVPEFLLRPWVREWQTSQNELRGYYWQRHEKRLRYRQKGVGAFCHSIDLLTLWGRREGRAVLESRFFQAIDQHGRTAVDTLIAKGPNALTSKERSDFARLMLSLEYRRPAVIRRLRTEATATLVAGLNDAPDVVAELRARGINEPPSEYAQKEFGWSFEDRAMLIVQQLVDIRAMGERIINAHWHVKKLRREHGTYMLADRPLVRTHGLEHQAATWFLPLTPKFGFYATLHPANLRLLKKSSPRAAIENSNYSTVQQAERFVFSVEKYFPSELVRLLRRAERR